MWMAKWAKPTCTPDRQNLCTNCSLYLKNSIFSPTAKVKNFTLSKAKTSICHGTNSIPVYKTKFTIDLKSNNLATLAFKKDSTPPPPSTKSTKTEPSFRKLNSLPTKLCMPFSAHPLGQGAMATNQLPVIAARMEPYSNGRAV